MDLKHSVLKKGVILISVLFSLYMFGETSIEAQTVKYLEESVYIKIDLMQIDQTMSTLTGEQIAAISKNIQFSGKAEIDFDFKDAIVVEDPGNIAYNGRDVFMESPAPPGTSSGWDMKTIYMYYSQFTDTMYVGIHMFTDTISGVKRTICGDADGDNDPGRTSEWLRKIQGTDTLDLRATEAIVLLIDTDVDGEADVAIGVNQFTEINAFAAYNWHGEKFKYPFDEENWGNRINNVNIILHAKPDSLNPDLEFKISNFSKLPDLKLDPSLVFKMLAFAGSDEDAGIGDDYIPGKKIPIPVDIYFSDFGDAPIPYPTLFENDGAYHDTSYNLYLGYKFDPDSNGYPSEQAIGDDITGIDDEDGVAENQLTLYEGTLPKIDIVVRNETQQKAYIVGWIDFNGNKKWEETEKAIENINVSGKVTLKFPLVLPGTVKTTFARFRVSTNLDSVNQPIGKAPDGEVEDYTVEIKRFRDFGDAPDDTNKLNDYPTLLLSNGAFHSFVPNEVEIKLGDKIDHESDGQPSTGAVDDDNNGIDDEDAFNSNLIYLIEGRVPNLIVPVVNNSNMTAKLNCWIDFNGNGSWQFEERATTIVPIGAASVTISFPKEVPFGCPITTYARFRISTDTSSISNPTGWAPDGEVEDYHVRIEKYDFGDAPDPLYNTPGQYPTLLDNNGARHKIGMPPYKLLLGVTVDPDGDGQPTPGADGDNDDAITPGSLVLTAGTIHLIDIPVINTYNQTATVVGWVDYDGDGYWEVDERADTTIAYSGKATLKFRHIPLNSVDTTYARFRISTDRNIINKPDEVAPNGEVEDYRVFIKKYDFGDAPDNPQNPNDYPTFLKSNGAYHEIGSAPYKLYLGEKLDPEGDGIPTTGAVGDDTTNIDDEDGIGSNPIKLIEGTTPEITVRVVNNSGQTAILNGWIDFDRNGTWELKERAQAEVPSGFDSVILSFNQILNGSSSTTYARFRISTDSASISESTGFSPDGEVEDYHVSVVTLYDYGDAPDGPYQTLLSSNGARHKFLPDMNKLCLGDSIDFEMDGIPTAGADGDDNTGIDDEDGLVRGDTLYLTVGDVPSIKVRVVNETNKTAYVRGWIDYTGKGDWNMSTRAASFTSKPGIDTVILNFPPVPLDAPVTTYARFRVSTDSVSIKNPDRIAPDGEVEDYQVIIDRFDFGDAPDPVDTTAGKYPTLLANNGARHKVSSDLYFGDLIDHELDGQPTDDADGDGADEDIFTSSTIILGADWTHQIDIPVFNNTGQEATVVGWIDYDKDGIWEPEEKADTTISSLGLTTATLKFKNIPQSKTDSTYARFRISTGDDSIATPYGQAPDGEVEDYKVKIIALDFGDAPDDPQNLNDYPTLLVSDGARHTIKSGFFLGDTVDFEGDGQSHPNALGDVPDEDGVIFHRMPLMVCSPETVTVVASQAGRLNAWIDFNDDNDWDDPGEHIFIDSLLDSNANVLTFTVPDTAAPTSQTFARFRFNSTGGLSYKGLAENGEVEDYEVKIDGFDFGDAPESSYHTLLTNNGAYHKIKEGFFLGNSIDAEFDGQPDNSAKGDDNNAIDDEDGVAFITANGDTTDTLVAYQNAQLIVIASSDTGKLDAWIDFNNDGDWNDPKEKIFNARALNLEQNILTFTVPCSANATPRTYARFRYSSQGGLPYDGPANNGEVEDYAVSIIALDFGDAPDDPQNPDDYPTLLVSDGARHIIKSGFYLGNDVDCEGDGQPHPHALGDIPDEDGVVFHPMPLIIGRSASITVIASDTGKLDAWIDFDDNGDWAGAHEQIFTNQLLMPGSATLAFPVPLTADTASQTFARFRFSSEGNLSYNGLAQDGEVEDYEVEIIGFDFGDAPDDPYPTLLADSGAYHKIKPGFFLGDSIDAEADGQPNSDATGDDVTGEADEDGVDFDTYPLIISGTAQITVTAADSGMLDAWIDFNVDGDWADPGEQIFKSEYLNAKSDTLTFTVPCDAEPTSQTFARFRFSSQGGLSFEGYAADGEVEDYKVEIIAADFGDAPDDSVYHYATLLTNNGVHHQIKPGFYLGTGVDFEGDGKQNREATGDNFDDGVKFSKMPLILCREDTITVTASDTGKLYAWIDSDCNGNWTNVIPIFTGESLTKGENILTFTVPSGTNPKCSTFVRFRFTSMDSLSYEGFAEDGEVEDYKVEIIGYDFGDAPDPFEGRPGRYPTLMAYNGARHQIDPRLYLGEKVDANADGPQTIAANGDDIDAAGDDEDGLAQDTLRLNICTEPDIVVKVHNSTEKDAFVICWIDFHGSYGWTEPEKVMAIAKPGVDSVILSFDKIPSYSEDTTYARIRISTDLESVDKPWGCAPDGEVEDYLVIISKKKAAEISSFNAIAENGTISINWSTNMEPDCEHFVIYRSQNDTTDFIKIQEAVIPGEGDSTAGAVYNVTDQLDEIGTYYYKLECVSPDGYSNFHGPISVKLLTIVKPQSSIPKEYSLSQNYPNPFNPETQIQFALPKDGQVTIEIYDVLGRLVRTIVNEYKSAGAYHVLWDARNNDGNMVSNGIYLLQMKSGSFIAMKKMTLIK